MLSNISLRLLGKNPLSRKEVRRHKTFSALWYGLAVRCSVYAYISRQRHQEMPEADSTLEWLRALAGKCVTLDKDRCADPPRLINSSWIANSCVSDALPIYTAEMMIRDVTEVCIFLLSGTIWWQQQHKCRCHLFAAGRCFSALKPHTHTHTPRTFLTPKSYFCFKLITASCVFSFKFICHITKLEPTDVY